MLPARPAYPPELPVSQARDGILAALRRVQVLVVCGETGSGKTTQLPKLALEVARERLGVDPATGRPKDRAQLGCTQPRRLAAAAVAARVAEELQVPLGAEVGFQVRFTQVTSAATALKFMTDGILLAEIRRDPELRSYHTLILDEVHERSRNLDFLLGYLKLLLPRRPDLKLILSSATLEVERFSQFFGGPEKCPVIQVEGRSFPVEIAHRAPPPDEELARSVLHGVEELSRRRPAGDILVFLPGEREIRDAAELLAPRFAAQAAILPLYGRQTLSSQQQIFHPGAQRRIILATNIAETSLTIPRIHCVLDSGLHRLSRWTAAGGVQRLVLEPIAQANARQRAGRCGRLGPGLCLRLYSQEQHDDSPAYPEPEIRRQSLAATLLAMKELGLPEPRDFPFLDPPAPALVSEGLRELQRLGALDRRRELTPLGRQLARLPLDPPLARFLLAAREAQGNDEECDAVPPSVGLGRRRDALAPRNAAPQPTSPASRGPQSASLPGAALRSTPPLPEPPQPRRTGALTNAACILAAALTIQDPRERPADKRKEAEAAHAHWRHPDSDFLSWLQLWPLLRPFRDHKKFRLNPLRKFCAARFLSWRRVIEWDQLARELHASLHSLDRRRGRSGAPPESAAPHPRTTEDLALFDPGGLSYQALHTALLAGLPWNLGLFDPDAKHYRCPRQPFALFPGSTLFQAQKRPRWVLAWDIATTTRTWARQAARIEPEWAETAAPHLVQSGIHSPRYDAAMGVVTCLENLSFGGLPIVRNRPRAYQPFNPEDAHALFIREALLDGQLDPARGSRGPGQPLPLLVRLEELRGQAETLDAKLRQGGRLWSDELVEDWLAQRVPADIAGAKAFRRWLARAQAADPAVLDIPLADCLAEPDAITRAAELPDEADILTHNGLETFPLYWAQAPGARDDGPTLGVHIDQLPALPAHAQDWLVAPLLPARVEALLRTLPKAQRVPLQPYPDTVARFLADHPPGSRQREQSLVPALLAWLRQSRRLRVFPDQFHPELVPTELRVKLWICDDDDEELAFGTDADALRTQLRLTSRERAANLATQNFDSRPSTSWTFGPLLETVPVDPAEAGPARVHPCLVDLGNAVAATAWQDRPGSREHAALSHRAGLARLLQLSQPQAFASLAKSFPFPGEAKLRLQLLTGVTPDPDRLVQLAAETSFAETLPRDAVAFAAAADTARVLLLPQAERLGGILAQAAQILTQARAFVERHREKLPIAPPPQHHSAVDLSEQLGWMLRPDWLGPGQGPFLLTEFPLHLRALAERLQRLQAEPRRDVGPLAQLRPAWERWHPRWLAEPTQPDLLAHGQLLADYRLLLFAPSLPRPRKISAKRLDEHWRGIAS